MKEFLNKFSKYYITFCIYALIGWLYEVLWMWFVVPPKHFINRGVLIGPFLPIYGFGMLILLFLLHKFMSKKHELKKPVNLIVSVSVITTFIYTTVIEYTTTPKILSVVEYLQRFGVGLLITNLVCIGFVYLVMKITENKKLKELNITIILVFLAIWIITTLIEYVSHFAIDKLTGNLLWDYTKDFLNINARVNWDASRNFAIGGTFLLYTVQPLINKCLPKLAENKRILITCIIGIPMLLDFILHVLLKVI